MNMHVCRRWQLKPFDGFQAAFWSINKGYMPSLRIRSCSEKGPITVRFTVMDLQGGAYNACVELSKERREPG